MEQIPRGNNLIIKIILQAEIILYGDLNQYEKLIDLPTERKSEFTYSIKYPRSKNDAFLDMNLIEILMYLRDLGFLFQEDHKEVYSPTEFMRELLRRGYKIGGFKTINGLGHIRHFN